MKTLSEKEACQKHEYARQAFIDSMNAAYDCAQASAHAQARFELLRANAATAQGLVYAELIGIDPTGWLDRMHEIERLWEKVQ